MKRLVLTFSIQDNERSTEAAKRQKISDHRNNHICIISSASIIDIENCNRAKHCEIAIEKKEKVQAIGSVE